MIILCRIPVSEGLYRGYDRAGPIPLRPCNRSFSLLLLRGRVGEDSRAVLSPHIIALPVQCGGLMRSEQHVQQVAIADHFRVKGNAKGLGMTGCPCTDILVGGIRLVDERAMGRGRGCELV